MRLSDDGTILLSVTPNDIHEGRFIIPNTVTCIGARAFRGCTPLTEVSIPEGVVVGVSAFSKCTSLTTVNLAQGVTIEVWGFDECTSLTKINFSKGVKLGAGAFKDCRSLIRLSFPEDITFDDSAFRNCDGLIELNLSLPKGHTIPIQTFKGCARLTALHLAEGVIIEREAFHGCTALTKLNIPKGVVVRGWAFEQCTNLTTLSLAEGVQLEKTSFKDCPNLKIIIVDSDRDEELIRIKSLFPQHQHAHFVKQSVYDRVCSLQDRTYQEILQEPRVSGLYGCHQSLGLIDDILRVINVQEHEDHIAYRLFHDALKALPFPADEHALEHYAQQLHSIVKKTIAKICTNQCVAKLKTYLDYLEGLIADKCAAHPGFFNAQPACFAKLKTHCAAVQKLIDFLGGNKEIRLSLNSVKILQQGFVGQTLTHFKIPLAELLGLKEPTDEQKNERKRKAAPLEHGPLKKQKCAPSDPKEVRPTP